MDVSVVIATMAARERGASLERALNSLRQQTFGRAIPIVVVNGRRRDSEVVDFLRHRTDVRLLDLEEGNLPKALAAGRNAVTTEFFGFLDDDDEYLPNALAVRFGVMEKTNSIDVVVTNGLVNSAAGDEPQPFAAAQLQQDPIGALVDTNWLASCGALYRTSTVDAGMFLDMPPYLEWTYLAYRLCISSKIVFVDEPTFRVYSNSYGALSSSDTYVLEGPPALKKIYALNLPADTRKQVREKYIRALHNASALELARGHHRSAWKFHLKSITSSDGLKYLTYTRHLFLGSAARMLGFS